MNTKLIVCMVLCTTVFVSGICVGSALGDDQKNIIIAGSHAAGTWYRFAGAVGALVDKYIPGYRATAQPSPGSVQNIRNLRGKNIEIAMLLPAVAYQAYKGMPPFEKDPYQNVRALFNTYSFPDNIVVRENSPVKSLEDIKGLKIAIGPPGSGSQVVHKIILAEYGLSVKDCKTQYLTNNEAANALTDGNVDVAFVELPLKASVINELMTMHKVRHVPLSMEKLKSINKKYPYLVPGTIKAGTYERIKQDVPAIFQWGILCTDANANNELIYGITKLVFDHKKELVQMVKLVEEMSTETAATNLPIPLHAGAEKYYKEIGVLK
jgi:TRAP transporter TAXI family solute receptor